MQKLNVHGKLVLGLIVAMTAAFPLACGSDDSNGVPNEEGGASGNGGAGGKGGAAGAGKGGAASAGKGGAGKAGETSNGGGAPEAGAAEMGGEGGAAPNDGMAGAGGAEEMAGAGGEGGAAGDPVYDANVEAACTTEGSLNCSGDGAAADKEACVQSYTGLPDFVPECSAKVKAFLACIAPLPVADFECTGMQAAQKVDFCNDEYIAMFDCFSPPEP